jgi:GAF domain-containing protein
MRYTHSTVSAAEEFKSTTITHGLWSAMRWLNEQVPYRYTAIFGFHGDMLRNVCMVDKRDPVVTHCADQPITESYCIFIHRTGASFGVEDSLEDPRVAGHPKRHTYRSYYGIPLFGGSDGRMLGTMCHFDPAPMGVTPRVIAALDDVAPFIAEAVFG